MRFVVKKQLFNDVVRFNQRAMAKLPLEFDTI